MAIPSSASKGSPLVAGRRQLVGAAGWTTAGYVIAQIMRFGSNLALTRLLAPDAFGLMFLATGVMITVALVCDAGFREVVVRSERGQNRAFLDTVWSLQILRGALLTIVGWAIAAGLWAAERSGNDYLGGAYDDPRFPLMLAVLSAGFVIHGCQSTRIWSAVRHMDTRRMVCLELANQVIGLVAMFAWAALDPSVWAIVAGTMASSIGSLILSHRALPGSPDRWRIEPAAAREILRFGRWIWLSSIVTALSTQFDKLFFGAVAEPGWMGHLAIATNLVFSLEAIVSRLASSIGLPYFSSLIRVDRAAALRRYHHAQVAVDCLTFLLTGFVFIAGPLIVGILYPNAYSDAGWMLSVLSVIMLTNRLCLCGQFLMADDRASVQAYVSIVKLVVLVASVLTGYAVAGLIGAVIGVAAHAVALYVIVIAIDLRSGVRLGALNALPFAALLVGAAAGRLAMSLFGH